MFHHIRKFSSTIKASPVSVLYPKDNNNNKVMRVMDQTRFINEESSKKAAAAATTLLIDQISVRPVERTDVDDIMVWATDERLSHYWETYRSKENMLEDIKMNLIPHPWYKAICLNNRPIGKIFFGPCGRSKQSHCANFGYVVAPIHWGKGIATTAVKMVLDTVFKERPHLERLETIVDVENLGALRVLEKAGFLKECVLRKYLNKKGRTVDMAIFSFLSSDFKG